MLAFLCLILHLASAYGSTSKGKSIILLAGQSNMSGRGGVHNNTWDGVVPLQSQPNPSILRLTANLTWVEAREPLHKDIDVHATCGVGPGMAFANRLLQRDPGLGPLGLVPCAVGGPRGTSISEWGRGTFLYKQLLRRAKVARRDGGSISGMLWYQGESDTVSEVDARMYKMRLVNLFRNLRADLGTPLLPIVHVAIASANGPYIEIVRKAQLGITLPKVRCVDAKGLPLLEDKRHLSTLAQERLGLMLADAFLALKRCGLTKQKYAYQSI
ncbi:putative acetylxylan esterase [Helianthus annuus]|uniref:Acetylxylan esterase n=1 Tax=Helianthus annuus TaxID=4232 RepID=A0A251TFP0_HELAN|nr:probable carbohydrate esterase At4g34215 [Helianthus annuus]KAF5780522.1 putative acetylxylan esterase [Helianthus annuus]KAJ0507724.1 putative acetylxylan esterase [Helianthus annuus]KAJ0869182.1 putative acetylxylan esterase [Helianthus annuus]KAJ0873743.1 putative acetylxylan esterase [Helianthus annuus]